MENILKDILNEGRVDEIGVGRDAIKAALRSLNELMTNMVSITKQIPDYQKFRRDTGDYMDAIALVMTHAGMNTTTMRPDKEIVVDALNAIFKMAEQKDKFIAAKKVSDNLLDYFNRKYK